VLLGCDLARCRCVLAKGIDDQLAVAEVAARQRGDQHSFAACLVYVMDVAMEVGLEGGFRVCMQWRLVLLIVVPKLNEVELGVDREGLRPKPLVEKALGGAAVRGEVDAVDLGCQIATESRTPATLGRNCGVADQHYLDARCRR
jgi:hypothetical protein